MEFIKKLFRKKTEPITKKDIGIIAAGLTIFGVLSIGNMARWSVWFDEAFSVYLTRFSFAEVAQYTAADVHPPLYYWLLKAWQIPFGDSEIALRSLSMVMVMVAVVFVYLLVRRVFDLKTGAVVMVFMVLSPMMLRYSEEARMYGMVMAIVAAATYLVVDASAKSARWKWVVYGILVSLGMWTHYFTAIIWLTHWVWRYMVVRTSNARQTAKLFWSKEWIYSHALAIALFLPWLPIMVKQMATVQGGGFWISPVTPTTPFNFLTNILLFRENHEAQGWFALAMLIALIALVWVVVTVLHRLKNEQRRYFALCLVMAIVPMVLLVLLSMPPLRPAFVDRYLIATLPFWSAIFGVGVATLIFHKSTKRIGVSIGVSLSIMMILGVGYLYTIGNFNKNANDPLPIRPTVESIQRLSGDGTPILTASSWRFYETHYYDTERNPVYFEATDNLTWGSYDMLRYNNYRKIYDTVAFAQQHDGTIWYVGDWRNGEVALPTEGQWRVIREAPVDGLSDKTSTIRAAEIELISE